MGYFLFLVIEFSFPVDIMYELIYNPELFPCCQISIQDDSLLVNEVLLGMNMFEFPKRNEKLLSIFLEGFK